MSNFTDWVHDDQTWCIVDCEQKVCYRNKLLMKNPKGVHSFSDFRNTDECMRFPKQSKKEDK